MSHCRPDRLSLSVAGALPGRGPGLASSSGARTPTPAVEATPCTRLSAPRVVAKSVSDERATTTPISLQLATSVPPARVTAASASAGEAFLLYRTMKVCKAELGPAAVGADVTPANTAVSRTTHAARD